VPSSKLKTYLPTSEDQSAANLPAPAALAWLTGELHHLRKSDQRPRTVYLSTGFDGDPGGGLEAFSRSLPTRARQRSAKLQPISSGSGRNSRSNQRGHQPMALDLAVHRSPSGNIS
jgi:hypothetical protein